MSMTGVEGLIVSEWVMSALAADAQIGAALGLVAGQSIGSRVWEGVAPEGTPFPHVVFTVVEPQDIGTVPLIRVMVRVGLQVKAIGKGPSYRPLIPVVQRIDAALQGAVNRPTSQGGMVLSCERVSAIQYPEMDQGVEYRHLGGTFQVHAQ